jgi:LCP family protein required for cell wall assembly
MSKRKKRMKFGTFIFILVLTGILCGTLLALYREFVKDSPAFEFVGRILSIEDGGKNIRERRKRTNYPYPITNNQKYYRNLVDKENINLLLIGPDESGSNYDTLLIVSLDDVNNVITFINLPRDIYVDYSHQVKAELKKVWPSFSKSKGIYKINAGHLIGKRINYKEGQGRFKNAEYDFTADLIEEIFGIYVDDFVYIKPSSLRRVVDYFGGVEIDVPYLMKYSDPTQGLKIHIEKGLQTLDGAKAEGFVRYRQGIDEKGKYKSIGDIERKKNQITFVKSFIDQHMSLKNLGKIITIFNDLDSYITTSIGSPIQAADYGKVAEKLYKNKFTQVSEEIECENKKIDGIYYLIIKEND